MTITDIKDSYPNKIRELRGYTHVVNAGVSGNTSSQMLARFDTDVLAFSPSAISIEAGTNDPVHGISVLTYTSNVTTMVQKAKKSGARVTIFVSPYATDPTLDADIEPYREAARSIAASEGTEIFDIYDDMADLSSGDKTLYFPDGVHFSTDGNLYVRDEAALPGNSSAFTSW